MTGPLKPGAKHQALMTLGTSGLHQRAIAVGMLLIDHCNAKTLRCDPGEARLAQLLRWGRNGDRKVRRALQDLVKAGWLAIDRHRGQHGTNRYRLDWARFAEAAATRAALGRDRALGSQVGDSPKVSGDPGQIRAADPDSRCPTNRKREPQKRTLVPLSGAANAAHPAGEDSRPPIPAATSSPEPVPDTPATATYLEGHNPFELDPERELPGLPAKKVAWQGEPGRGGDRQFDGNAHLEQAQQKRAEAEGSIFRLSELEERDRRQGNLMLPIRGGRPQAQVDRHAAENRWSSLACQKLLPEAVSAITQDMYERATAAEQAKPRGGWTGFNLVMKELRHAAA